MKSASVLNMSPSGRQLHFYSLTLNKLKLISWTQCLSEASAAGCRLFTEPAQKTLPSFHLIWGLDLIKDLQPSPLPPPTPQCRLVKVALSWWVFARGSSDSPTCHEHNKGELQHTGKRESHPQSQNYEVICWPIYTWIYQQSVTSVRRSTIGIVSNIP